MKRNDIICMAREAGLSITTAYGEKPALERFADLVVAAERKIIMDSLQNQADLATDALNRRWALEMIAAVAARSNT